MLKVKKIKFKEKFTEINIRQRMYKKKSFITLMINTEFYPSLVGDVLVSGVIEAKLDIKDIKVSVIIPFYNRSKVVLHFTNTNIRSIL